MHSFERKWNINTFSLIKDLHTPLAPNNDGLNDIFLLTVEGFDTEKYDLQIYNRWEELIFSRISATNGWDGTYQGQAVQLGSYVWKLKIKKLDSTLVKELHGKINVIR